MASARDDAPAGPAPPAPAACTSVPSASPLASRSEPSEALTQAISGGPRYNLYSTYSYTAGPTIAAMETLRRTDCDPMVTEAYNGIQFLLRAVEDIARVMQNNAQIDNTVVRAVDRLNNWTLDSQKIIDSVKFSVDDLDAKVQSFLSRMDYFANELSNNDQLIKATANSIHQDLGRSIANQMQVDSTLHDVANAVGRALQAKFDAQARDITKVVEEVNPAINGGE